jgi:hypothetical protein
MRLLSLIDELQAYYDEYESDTEVRIQDEDGIYESKLVKVEEANGVWLIVKTQEREHCEGCFCFSQAWSWRVRLRVLFGRPM